MKAIFDCLEYIAHVFSKAEINEISAISNFLVKLLMFFSIPDCFSYSIELSNTSWAINNRQSVFFSSVISHSMDEVKQDLDLLFARKGVRIVVLEALNILEVWLLDCDFTLFSFYKDALLRN